MVVASTVEHDLNKVLAIVFCLYPFALYAELHVVVVEGLGGDERYTKQFSEQVDSVSRASESVTSAELIKVFRSDAVSRDAVLEHFSELANETTRTDQIAVYLVGHGSFDDHEYKFNIAGPDLTGADIRDAMDSLPSDHQLLVNTSSASGAMAEMLENERRLLILATRSGVERHATRFGSYFFAAFDNPTADLNKNEAVSVSEAFQFAERQVNDYFSRNDQLATEHPRMEGSRGDRFVVARLSSQRSVQDGAIQQQSDPELRRLEEARDALNSEIDELRLARDQMSAEEYQVDLLQKLLELAATEDDIEARELELGIAQ